MMQHASRDSELRKYKQDANTFSLSAIYTENKVTITLKDYMDWAIYERTYSEQDIGKQIHKGIGLHDLCKVFTVSNKNGYAEMHGQETQNKELKNYCFGQTVENQSGSSYKIQRNGVISIYVNVQCEKDKKDVRRNSILHLNKVWELKDIEISKIKKKLQKGWSNNEIAKEMKKMKNDNQQLKLSTAQLKETIAKLQNQIKEVASKDENRGKQVIQIIESKQKQVIDELTNTLTNVTSKLESQQKQTFVALDSKLINAVKTLENQQKEASEIMEKKLNDINSKLDNEINFAVQLQKKLKGSMTLLQTKISLFPSTLQTKLKEIRDRIELQRKQQKQDAAKLVNLQKQANLTLQNKLQDNAKKLEHQQKQTNELLQSKLTDMSTKFQNQQKQLMTMFENELKEVSVKFQNEQKQQNAKLQSQQKQNQQKTMKQVMRIKNQLNTFQQQATKKINKLMNKLSFVDRTTPHYNQFQIVGNTIKYISHDSKCCQILMSQVIPKNRQYSFKIKILSTYNSKILLGIVDRIAGKNNQCSYGQSYAIQYFCFNGWIQPTNLGIKGVKINNGETVQVIVDLSKGKVQFKVSDVIKATVNNYKILTEHHREFVPSIEMIDFNDCVQWIENQEVQC